MFQALSSMELPPDPHNNPHLKAEQQRFRTGIQPIISLGDDATLGKRKASLTADESAKAQRIASIEQGLYILDQWKSVQPHSYFMELNRPKPIDLGPSTPSFDYLPQAPRTPAYFRMQDRSEDQILHNNWQHNNPVDRPRSYYNQGPHLRFTETQAALNFQHVMSQRVQGSKFMEHDEYENTQG